MSPKKLGSRTEIKEGPASGSFSFDSLVYPWNSPIPVVLVEGDSYEMGRQFGAATKAIIKRDIAFNLPTLEKVLDRSKLKKKDYLAGIESSISRYTDSGYLDEINGMAEAAGVEYETLLLVNCNADILSILPSPEEHERFFCSMFAAWDKATTDGSTIAGHNDDGGRLMDQFAVLKVAKPKHGYPFVCPQVPGYLAYDCLVNASQLFVCGTAVDDKIKNSEAIYDGVPNWAIYRWLGQYSSGVEDAIKRLSTARSMTLKNWCFIGKGQGGKVLEATPKHQAYVRHPSKTKDWFGVSTCTLCPELDPYLAKVKSPSSGEYRCASVKREVKARYGEIDTASGMEILSSHYDSSRKRNEASEHTPCRHMEYDNRFAGTCRSLVSTFAPDTKETKIDVSLGNPCYGYWRELELDSDFRIISGYDEKSEVERHLARLLKSM
jgi:hypothetical protein